MQMFRFSKAVDLFFPTYLWKAASAIMQPVDVFTLNALVFHCYCCTKPVGPFCCHIRDCPFVALKHTLCLRPCLVQEMGGTPHFTWMAFLYMPPRGQEKHFWQSCLFSLSLFFWGVKYNEQSTTGIEWDIFGGFVQAHENMSSLLQYDFLIK